MIVLIAGMYRSGSTFTFNIVRELLSSTGTVGCSSTNSISTALAENPSTTHVIIKSHSPDAYTKSLLDKGELVCICSYRKPEDALLSWQETFGFEIEKSVGDFAAWMMWHRSIVSPVLNIDYDLIDRHPLLAIMRMQKYIAGVVDVGRARELRRLYSKTSLKAKYDDFANDQNAQDIGFSYYDNVTFFHRRHISSVVSRRATEVLPAAVVADIRSQLGDLVTTDGSYEPEASNASSGEGDIASIRSATRGHGRTTHIPA